MRAIIDRIESGKATLLLGEDESVRIVLPLRLLPVGVKEGGVLDITISIDKESTEQGRMEVQSLLDALRHDHP